MDLGQGVLLGVAAGMVGGIMGIGGGMIIVPALVLLGGIGQHQAQGISLTVVAITSLVGAVTHYRQRTVRLELVIWVVPLAVVCGILGAQLAIDLDANVLRKVFGIVLLIMSVVMVVGEGDASREDTR